ncbi:MAG: hypothetical protein AAB830_01770 [Patescibacteria group bacterium]
MGTTTLSGALTLSGAAFNEAATVVVASAASTPIGAAASNNVDISGTVTITSFDTVADGINRKGRFTGALTLTHNATSLILPGAANITTAANDRYEARSLGSGNWLVTKYEKADGKAVGGVTTKALGFTRDTALASGTQAVTGAGFKPSAAFVVALQHQTREMGLMFFDSTFGGSGYSDESASVVDSYSSKGTLYIQEAGANRYEGTISSWDNDGATFSWTRIGAPTGTLEITVLFIK